MLAQLLVISRTPFIRLLSLLITYGLSVTRVGMMNKLDYLSYRVIPIDSLVILLALIELLWVQYLWLLYFYNKDMQAYYLGLIKLSGITSILYLIMLFQWASNILWLVMFLCYGTDTVELVTIRSVQSNHVCVIQRSVITTSLITLNSCDY